MSSDNKPRKYVPPALRNRTTESSQEKTSSRDTRSSGYSTSSSSSNRREFPSSFGGNSSGNRSYNNNSNSGYNPRAGWNSTPTRKKPDVTKRNAGMELELYGDPSSRVKTGIDFDKYASIEVEISGPEPKEPFKEWSECKLHDVIKSNIELAGYNIPTPVQKYSVPNCCANKDMMSCAQTGSGKTAGFLLPCIQNILDMQSYPDVQTGRGAKICPLALVLAPTRELAIQIHEESKKFMYRTGLRSCVVYGGQRMGEQLRDLESGFVDIIIATPGRLWDFVDRGKISLGHIKYLVFDEADRMLDMGFEIQIRDIVNNCDMPPKTERQTSMFSATFPREIQKLASDFLNDYVFLAVGRVGSATENVTQEVVYAPEREKRDLLMKTLQRCEGLTLIFVETKRNADWLERILCENGIEATSIHGDRTQFDRVEALEMFKCGRCPVLVATSVAARGLDIPNVKFVINYDCPNNRDDYVHRIGRTGRAGHHGTAVAFINEETKILNDIYELMEENNSVIEEWFGKLIKHTRSSYGRSNGRGRKGKGNNYGGRDMRLGRNNGRYEDGNQNNRNNSRDSYNGRSTSSW